MLLGLLSFGSGFWQGRAFANTALLLQLCEVVEVPHNISTAMGVLW